MLTREILDYIRQRLAAGISKDELQKSLASVGWSVQDITDAFFMIEQSARPAPPTVPPIVSQGQSTQAMAPQSEISQPLSNPNPTVASAPTVVSAPKKINPLLITLPVAIVLVLVGGGAVYAYVEKVGPFSQAPYTQDNLISGLLAATAGMHSASYTASAAIAVNPRDAGAVPFTSPKRTDAQLQQYKNDTTRAQNIESIIAELETVYGIDKAYPATLQQLQARASALNLRYTSNTQSGVIFVDPVTGQQYAYSVTSGGSDYNLSVTFETADAVSYLGKPVTQYAYSSGTTAATKQTFAPVVKGKTITFSKQTSSAPFYSLPSELPQPLFEQLGESMKSLSADTNGSLSVAAASDWKDASSTNWKFNVDATGNFGDLSFKIDADALKKDKNYYVRINNIPSLIGDLSFIKGQWIVIDPAAIASSTGSTNGISSFASGLPDAEKSYEKNRAQAADLIKQIASFADEEHLFSIVGSPRSEKVNGQDAYRYDLKINKDALVPFYKKMAATADTNQDIKNSGYFDDPTTLEYLQSDEFAQIFDYYYKNTTLTLWVDPQGLPAQIVYTMRVVPPDSVGQFAGKQVDVTWKSTFSDINKPIEVSAPANAKPLMDVINKLFGSSASTGTDAAVQSNLETIQTQAEIYYGSHANSYGSQAWVTGSAASCTGGMFSDSRIKTSLAAAATATKNASAITCYTDGDNYMVGAALSSGGWWCVDSLGKAQAETGSLPATTARVTSCP